MSGKPGWPKGKPRGPQSPEHRAKTRAALLRGRKQQAKKMAAMSSGHAMPGGDFRPQRAHIDTSPAVWLSPRRHVGDCEFVDNGVDRCLLRALRESLVYATSVGHQHEPPLQDVTIDILAAVERTARKYKIPRRKGVLVAPEPVVVPKLVVVEPVVFTDRQRQIVALIAAGSTAEEAGKLLGIEPRTVRMHADKLRARLQVERMRDIPFAFYKLTGENVFASLPEAAPAEEAPVLREGRSLLEVVSEMFES